jgi:4Fe-4S iron-sulfur cluster binding domain/DR2241 stabilising domain
MAFVENPALKRFAAEIKTELVLAQAMIRQSGAGYELRHVEDGKVEAGLLRELKLTEARDLAQYTAAGAFRPLKSAPNLKRGWRLAVSNDVELGVALDGLYPGAVADWYAVKLGNPPVTNYREYTARQSGMYRITTMLNDAQAGLVIGACCDRKFCLKQRLWSVTGLGTDELAGKSLIPCLEPCAVLMEFARKAMRIEQQEKVQLELAPDEVETLAALLKAGLSHPDVTLREGDVSAPNNPRRIQLLLEKLQPFLELADNKEEE